MANQLLWKAPTNVTSPVSGATVNAGAGNLSAAYNNESNLKRFANFELSATHSSAPTAGRLWLVYFIYSLDATNYEDGGTAVQPAKLHAVAFPVRAVGTAQVISKVNIPIAPFSFKVLLWNDTDQNSTASSVTLDMEVHAEDLQAT